MGLEAVWALVPFLHEVEAGGASICSVILFPILGLAICTFGVLLHGF